MERGPPSVVCVADVRTKKEARSQMFWTPFLPLVREEEILWRGEEE